MATKRRKLALWGVQTVKNQTLLTCVVKTKSNCTRALALFDRESTADDFCRKQQERWDDELEVVQIITGGADGR